MSGADGRAAPSHMASYGARLLARGYDLTSTAVGTKHPDRKGWQRDRVGLRHDAWRATQGEPTSAQQVANWSRENTIGGVGIMCANVCGVDLDITDVGVRDALLAYIEAMLGRTVLRVGRAPRVLAVYRVEGGPITHPATARYVDPDDLTAEEHGVDFIAGAGRQFVAYAVHPDTGRPYTYEGPELADTDRADLPTITREQCAAIAAEFARLANSAGWQQVQRAEAERTEPHNRDPEDTFFAAPVLPDVDLTRIQSTLDRLDPAAMAYGDWVRAIAAVHHQTGGSPEGLAIADAWSRGDGRYKPDDVATRWRGFGQGGHAPVTFASVLAWVRDGRHTLPDILDEPADFGVVEDAPAADRPRRSEFSLTDESEFAYDETEPDWLVEGYLVRGEASALYGDPGTYKSFLAVDLAYHIASGQEWHGAPVRQGAVVYVAGEGRNGLKARSRAWRIHHELDRPVPLAFTSGPINLSDREALKRAIPTLDAYAARFGGLGLIVVDTLARNNTADENSNTDMSVVMANAGDIQARYGCAVLILHHTGKHDKGRVRGASAIQGALDSSYRLDRQEVGVVKMVCTKMKDAEEPADRWFAGSVLRWGDKASSLVFEETEARSGEVGSIDVVDGLKGVQAALYSIVADEGEVPRDALRAIIEAEPDGVWSSDSATRQKQLRDALHRLKKKGVLHVPDEATGRVTTTAYRADVAEFGEVD